MKKVELESKIFDLERKVLELQDFIDIGDEKLIEAYEIVDKKQEIINNIKKYLNG